jgi:hypothetical protein
MQFSNKYFISFQNDFSQSFIKKIRLYSIKTIQAEPDSQMRAAPDTNQSFCDNASDHGMTVINARHADLSY